MPPIMSFAHSEPADFVLPDLADALVDTFLSSEMREMLARAAHPLTVRLCSYVYVAMAWMACHLLLQVATVLLEIYTLQRVAQIAARAAQIQPVHILYA